MDLEKLFESIYEASNYATETETSSLEAPMENKPMLFEEIYFECNVKPLFEQVLREAPLMSAENTANGSLYVALYNWYCDNTDNRTLTGCLQDYISRQNVSSNSPFMPAFYKTNIGNFITKPPKEENKQKIKSELVRTELGSKERKFWVEEVLKILRKRFTYDTDKNYLSEDDYSTIGYFFLNIENNKPEDNYMPETTNG